MAQHAWLDSLSEDWVSEPRSDPSDSPQPQLPTLPSPPVSANSKNVHDRASRIPRFNGANASPKRLQHQPHNSSPSVLSERTPNDINIRAAQLGPSKLSQEAKSSYRGRELTRSASASSSDSVVHNSVQHNRSQSVSRSKSRENAPEWKRRLIYGELDYGESKDLFSSAATGLGNIFRPPQAPEAYSAGSMENEGHTFHETTLPSSPPVYSRNRHRIIDDHDILELDSYNFTEQDMTLPKMSSFRRTEEDRLELSNGSVALTKERNFEESEKQLDDVANSHAMSLRRKQLVEEARKISGQSDMKNEDFSPIFMARHSSEGGGISFAPMDLSAQQLRKRLEILRRNQLILNSELDNDSGEMDTSNGAGDIENTEEYARNGRFPNLQRGGQSVAGSFRQRPPSPPLNLDTSDMLPESSLQASTPKQFPTVRIERFASAGSTQTPASPPSPSLPRAPHPSPEKRLHPTSIKTSSPLKLFGPHDTFTNQTLLRRISQFEDLHSNSADDTAPSPAPVIRTEAEPCDATTTSPILATSKPAQYGPGGQEITGDVSRFGAGELDEYEFDGDISVASTLPFLSEEKENITPPRSRAPSGSALHFDIHEDVLPERESLLVRRNRDKVNRHISSAHHIRVSKSLEGLRPRTSTGLNVLGSWFPPLSKRNGSEGKRPRTSPSKDPTPKRRRTLHRSDIAYGLEPQHAALETVQSSHYSMQSAITRDRKHTRQDQLQTLIEPNYLAMHHILRPRSLTPNQRPPLADLDFDPVLESAKAPLSGDDTGTLDINGSRKTSMKTQDFFDAAEEVMAMIRSKAQPMSGLASVEESEAENSDRPSYNQSAIPEDSFQESTQEPFSRPPSRDGQPVSRPPVRQEDPELINQLKKYEEQGDSVDMLSQSIRSMGTHQANDKQTQSTGSTNQHGQSNQSGQVWDESGIVSDIPNVRISHNPEHTEGNNNAIDFPYRNSLSSGGSTGRSIPTNSSRLDSKRLIAPDVVAQLIGNQVGNMVFDDVNKMWQKVKPPRPAVNILPSEDSEDDPFASIPDLTVDSVNEKRHLGLAAGKSWLKNDEQPQNESAVSWSSSKAGKTTEEFVDSEYSVLGNYQAHVETALEDDEEIDHEISLHEDRIHRATPARRKNLTITFSSPVASIIQDFPHGDSDSDSYEANSSLDYSLGSIAADSVKRGRYGKIGKSVNSLTTIPSQSQSRDVSRSFSVESHAFIPRPVSRIDEQDENASGDQRVGRNDESQISLRAESGIVASGPEPIRNTDLSVVMATPNPARTATMSATPIIGQYVGTFSLSPMSEFTVHQVDNSCALEVSYVVGDHHLITGDGSKKTMSKAIRSIVEKITEVEPFEPDWETVPELDLSNKQLDTLHMLDEFCTALVTLDASNNTVSHLDGVPQSVRNLRMTHNVLSELTAWSQLMNLQYVDVSNNQIKSLAAFKDLVHLRTLRADNNEITSLDGIKFHDSLQVLRARSNQITRVNFDGTKMQRLTELDLENNQIVEFENSEQLTSLQTLNIQSNCLIHFAPSDGRSLLSLRSLKLSDNDIQTLDVAVFPSLRLLHVDRNSITTMTGFSQCRYLDSLSLREQKGNNVLDTSFLDSACEVRKLFLSGNRLSGFNPGIDFLNLQYLELANCGLQSLAPDIGQLMPNLRVLNINFNAIDDLWPLRYIPRLKKLLAVGNRLSEAGKVANALAEFPHLSRLDLRNNGATLGFYAPVQTLVPAGDNGKEAEFDPFALPDGDVERQEKFASRLDMSTRMRKRVYDMVVLNDCRQLKMLDGLPVPKDIALKRDDVWKALLKSGIIAEEEEEQKDVSTQ
ncbi:hypothetical protein FHL15_001648 [Xylaria flabelliformis]|uniref:Septation initiation network scaffold protein cdc11 n=1 Tax=Xylaria flabelliformis TaxID=2512241 RepID=A0A553IAZ2_9PEZI|nr:hypothetical protein FHL15_001648 [Xylaria flabelliformis]